MFHTHSLLGPERKAPMTLTEIERLNRACQAVIDKFASAVFTGKSLQLTKLQLFSVTCEFNRILTYVESDRIVDQVERAKHLVTIRPLSRGRLLQRNDSLSFALKLYCQVWGIKSYNDLHI